MSVLTLSGSKINWAKPPKATTKVMWSSKDMYGRKVTGSLRTIAALDHLSSLAVTKFGHPVVVIQPPYNKDVAASAGTHDYDCCLDVYIPGVAWATQEKFFRANGAGAYHRKPPLFSNHIHLFILPVQEGKDRTDDFKVAGFKVGYLVDGGISLYGKQKYSAQIDDYYAHKNALANHAHDTGWFPADIKSTIFDLPAYIKRRQDDKPIKTTTIVAGHLNLPGPGVGVGPDLGNDAARIKNAVKLLGQDGKHLLSFNELGPRRSATLGSVFAEATAKAFGKTFTLIVPTLDFNENYFLPRNDRLAVVKHHADVILTASRGSGNKHLTVVEFKHHQGLVFVAGLTQLPAQHTAAAEADRQDMATQAQKALASIAGTKPYFLVGDVNTPKDLAGPVKAKMKRSRKYADKSAGALATFTAYTKTVPSTNAADWEIDQHYFSSNWYVLTYSVSRLLTTLKKYVTPRPSDHDAIVSSARVNHY